MERVDGLYWKRVCVGTWQKREGVLGMGISDCMLHSHALIFVR